MVARLDAQLQQTSTIEDDKENSDEDIDDIFEEDIVSEEDEYFFPTPEEIKAASKPKIGMSFNTINEEQRFVNIYGQLTRFSVIKGRNYKQKNYTTVQKMQKREAA